MSKKELKAPDEFQSVMLELWEKYGKYWKHFIIGLIIVIAVPVAISLYNYYNEKKENNAFNLYNDVVKKFEKEKNPEVLEKFINKFKGTKANYLARIRLANFYFNKGDIKSAYNLYKFLSEKNINKEFKNFAKLNMALCLYEMKKFNKSKEILERLKNDNVIGGETTLYLAFINEKNKNFTLAKQLYQKIIDRYKGFLYLRYAESWVNEM